MKYREIFFAAALAMSPQFAAAAILELSQGQMRTLVSQQQVLSSQSIMTGATSTFGGSVIEIRGFLSDGKMTYRLLLQHENGQVAEILIDGQSGSQVPHSSALGQEVSSVARTSSYTTYNASSDRSLSNADMSGSNSNASSNARSNNAKSGNSSNSRNRGNSGSRRNANGNNGKGNGN